jgi:hypothetical protein
MAKRLQLRGGTEAQNNNFVGAVREITVDTTNWSLRIHDGSTAGGYSLVSSTSPIPNQGGNSGKFLTTDGNQLSWNDIDTIFRVTASPSEPIGPQEGNLWYDIISGRMYVYYDESWIDASPKGNNGRVNPPTSSKGSVGDTIGSWSADSNYYYYCAASYTTGLVDIWRRVLLTGGSW